jgi:hypothetical protein
MSNDAQEIFDALCAPFAPEEIFWRVGPTNERTKGEGILRGQPLCYIDARSVMDRLDAVCGPQGWQDSYTPGMGTSIVCNIGIRLDGEWIWKGDGAGATDMEADKGALSDAFKRAGVRWGIGRYLYEIKAPWLPLEKRGTTAILTDAQHQQLDKLYEEAVRKIQPIIGVHAYRQAYRLLIATLKAQTPEAAKQYGEANRQIISELPAAMRDHVLSTLNRKAAAENV